MENSSEAGSILNFQFSIPAREPIERVGYSHSIVDGGFELMS
jgi:hypothetical protein